MIDNIDRPTANQLSRYKWWKTRHCGAPCFPAPRPFYCTVTCKLAVWLMDPDVAVTVTVLVPAGVPGSVGVEPPPLPPPPPQAINPPARVTAMTSAHHRPQAAGRLFRGSANRNMLRSPRSPVIPEWYKRPLSAACAAVVLIVKRARYGACARRDGCRRKGAGCLRGQAAAGEAHRLARSLRPVSPRLWLCQPRLR